MKRARPIHSLGGTPRTDHIFQNKESLCGKWFYAGGEEVEPEDVDPNDEDLCNECARKVEVMAA